MKKWIVEFSLNRPKTVISLMMLVTMLIIAAAGIRVIEEPNNIIDTDPENMLDKSEYVRVFHEETKEKFDLFDIVAMGIYHPGKDGAFTKDILSAINKVTSEIKDLKQNNFIIDKDGKKIPVNLSFETEVDGKTVLEPGIIFDDIMALSEVEDINGETGSLVINRLMPVAPKTEEEALEIKKKVDANPLLANKLVSADGKIVGIYVPIKSKKISYNLSQVMKTLAEKHLADVKVEGKPFFETGEYIVAGLPVAQHQKELRSSSF